MSVKRHFVPDGELKHTQIEPLWKQRTEVVLASSYDAACAERDAERLLRTGLSTLLKAAEAQNDALAARVERLEGALRELLSCPHGLDDKGFVINASIHVERWNRARAALSPQAENLEKEGV